MSKSRAEQETIIRRAADEDRWDVFSEDPKIIRKLERLGFVGTPRGSGFTYSLEAPCVSLRRAQQITEPERARRAAVAKERFAKARTDAKSGEKP